jgi:hypothetical protein
MARPSSRHKIRNDHKKERNTKETTSRNCSLHKFSSIRKIKVSRIVLASLKSSVYIEAICGLVSVEAKLFSAFGGKRHHALDQANQTGRFGRMT